MKTILLFTSLFICSLTISGCTAVSSNAPKNLSPDNEVCGNLKDQLVAKTDNNNTNFPNQTTYENAIVEARLYKQYEHFDCERDEEYYQPPLLSQNNHIHTIVE